MRPTTPNILNVWETASEHAMRNGLSWYPRANNLARTLDGGSGLQGAGVLAALSPITPWGRNVELACTAFDLGFLAGGTLPRNIEKVNRILDGEHPLDVLAGDKVRNFFMAIFDPTSPTAVVVDRHAFDIAIGKVTNDAARVTLGRKGEYARFARAYERAGREVGYSASTVQAVTWEAWRARKGIKNTDGWYEA